MDADQYVQADAEEPLTRLLVDGISGEGLVGSWVEVPGARHVGRHHVQTLIEYYAERGAGSEVPPEGWDRIEEAIVRAFREGVHDALQERRALWL